MPRNIVPLAEWNRMLLSVTKLRNGENCNQSNTAAVVKLG